jgi:flagellar hook-associated protein 2
MTLFGTGASATDGEVSYKTATANTTPGTYAVSITAAATRGSHTGTDLGGAFTYSASNGVSDTLSVTDSASGVTTAYVVKQGDDLDTIVSELNTAFGNAMMSLTAERSGNSLRIRASEYGSARSLTLAGTATTRLGMTAGTYAGTNVQGTIGGNAATGSGQVLTASAGFPTEGLAITYLGAAAKPAAGTVRFSRGIAGEMSAITDRQSRAGDGSVTVQTEVLDRSMDLLNDRIDNIQSRLDLRRQALIKQFTRMEEALSRFQSQSSSLISQLGSLSASSAA